MRSKQINLLTGTWIKDKYSFGGMLLKRSHAKTKRIFSKKLPMHIVMRSKHARGRSSLLRFSPEIANVLREQSDRHHVRLYSVANAGNHLHLLVQAPSRSCLSAFLRAVTGRVAQIVQKATQSELSLSTPKGFWDQRPFSRLVSPGRDFKQVALYLTLNSTESGLRMNRVSVRTMFAEIQELLKRGLLPRSASLQAAGFG